MTKSTNGPTRPDIEFLHDGGTSEDRVLDATELAEGVSAILTGPAAEELGPFVPGPLDHDGHPANWPGLRSTASRGFGGGQLHHNLGSGDIGLLGPQYIARDLQRTLDGLEWHRAAAAAAVRETFDRASAAINAHGTAARRARIAAVPFSASAPGDLRVGLDLEMLRNDLGIGVVPLPLLPPGTEDIGLEAALADHERRSAIAASQSANDWMCLLDETARRVLEATGLTVWQAIHRLHTLNGCAFRFERGRWTATLRWRDGTITADIHDRSTDLGLWNGELNFGDGLPHTLFDSLLGRRLGDVADLRHPFLAPGSIITDAFERGGRRFVTLSVPTSPVDLPF